MGISSSSSFAVPSAKGGRSSEIAMTSPQNGKKRALSPSDKRTKGGGRPPACGQEGGSPPPLYRHARAKGGRTDRRPPRPLPENRGCYCAEKGGLDGPTDGGGLARPASVEELTEEGQQQCRCAFCSFANGEDCDFVELGRSFGPCQRLFKAM